MAKLIQQDSMRHKIESPRAWTLEMREVTGADGGTYVQPYMCHSGVVGDQLRLTGVAFNVLNAFGRKSGFAFDTELLKKRKNWKRLFLARATGEVLEENGWNLPSGEMSFYQGCFYVVHPKKDKAQFEPFFRITLRGLLCQQPYEDKREEAKGQPDPQWIMAVILKSTDGKNWAIDPATDGENEMEIPKFWRSYYRQRTGNTVSFKRNNVVAWSEPTYEAIGPGTVITAGRDGEAESIVPSVISAKTVGEGKNTRLSYDGTHALGYYFRQAFELMRKKVVDAKVKLPAYLKPKTLEDPYAVAREDDGSVSDDTFNAVVDDLGDGRKVRFTRSVNGKNEAVITGTCMPGWKKTVLARRHGPGDPIELSEMQVPGFFAATLISEAPDPADTPDYPWPCGEFRAVRKEGGMWDVFPILPKRNQLPRGYVTYQAQMEKLTGVEEGSGEFGE